jgi:hypothetical protein
MDDETAKKSLSAFAYNQLFTKEFRKSKKLQKLNLDDGTINVWPCGQLMDCTKVVSIKKGDRCSCYRRTAFDHQCCHEICSDGGFDIERFGHHWLKKKTFQQMHPSFWLDDHLPACSNKDNESSIHEPLFNPEFDLDDDAEADLPEKKIV